MGVAFGGFAVPAPHGNSLMGFQMAATRIRSIGRWAAFVAVYALVFNVMLTSALLASISPLKFNALHELCLNGSSAIPDADGNSDSAKPIVRCPLCLSSAVATADQPPQTPALAIRIAQLGLDLVGLRAGEGRIHRHFQFCQDIGDHGWLGDDAVLGVFGVKHRAAEILAPGVFQSHQCDPARQHRRLRKYTRPLKADADLVRAAPPTENTDTGLPNDMVETARAWLNAPVTLPRRLIAKSEKPSRLFLNDTQIAGIKKRLNLTPAQQKYWQPVESAMREVTLQIEDYQKRLKKDRDDSFDTESDAITRLKTATRAFYSQLNGTQKNDLSLLVRMAGLGPAFAELTGTKMTKNEPENSR